MRIAWSVARALAPLAIIALGARAYAEPRIEKADQLFAEGKALLASNLLQACAKFDESLEYNPAAIGTLLNVALCDEKLGRVASAVAKFSEARDRAKEQGFTQHVRAAEQHIAALEPDVPHVTIQLTEQLPDTKVLIDDRVVALDAIANIAVDPGERDIVVSAPARLPYRAKVVVGKAEHRDVVIPRLARSVTITSSRRRIGQIITIGGVAAIGTGLGIGLYARNLYQNQFGHAVPGDGLCDRQTKRCESNGLKQTKRAATLGNVGTTVGVVGVAVAAVGVFLWIRSPSMPRDASDKKLTVVPQIGTDQLGIAALGRF